MTTTIRDAVPCPIPLLRRGDAPSTSRVIRTGELTAVMRGVYVVTAQWRTLAPWERYLVRVYAAAITYPGAVFCGESAAALHGAPVFLEPTHVHIVASPAIATSRPVAGVRFHTAVSMPATTMLGGFAVVTAAETAIDIARARHNAIGLAVAGAVMRADPTVTRDVLTAINEGRPTKRGRRRARWVIERATPVPESPLENVSLAAIEWLGFPAPELQQWVRGRTGEDDDRVDFLWPDWRIAGEADGALKYSGELGDAREALRERGARDARLFDRGIRATSHWDWADAATSAQLKAKLLAAGLPLIDVEDTAQLRSLAFALGARRSTNPSALRLH